MKRVPRITATEAATLVKNTDVLMAGGFGMTGHPVHLLHALAETSVSGLTYIGNNIGEANLGGGRLLRNGQVARAIGSYFTSNPEAVQAVQAGRLQVTLMPQGTLAEAIRAGGAGLGGFYTPTAHGTSLAEGAEVKVIDGVPQIFVPALRADVAFLRAWRADEAGNLVYRRTEQNFNKVMATAARLVTHPASTSTISFKRTQLVRSSAAPARSRSLRRGHPTGSSSQSVRWRNCTLEKS
jgi:3-oxoacid CoA-transferase